MGLVVNLLGGPGCGKSSTAAAVFAKLKAQDRNVELVTEYAHDRFWDTAGLETPAFPIYGFASQHLRIARVADKVDVVVTDAPILLNLLHIDHAGELAALVLAEHRRWPNLNIVLERTSMHRQEGRNQTHLESVSLDKLIDALLHKHAIEYTRLALDNRTAERVCEQVHRILSRRCNA